MSTKVKTEKVKEEKVKEDVTAPPVEATATSTQVTGHNDYILDGSRQVHAVHQNRTRRIEIPTYEELEKEDVIFHNLEYPGTMVKNIFFKMWKDAGRQFTFMDGGRYRLPKVLVDHVNENCQVKEDIYKYTDGSVVNATPVESETMPDYRKETVLKSKRYMFTRI